MFITRDPLGFVDGPNVYTYVAQNPWTKFDPKGLWFEDIFIALPSIAIGAKSLYNNIKAGNVGGAILDSVGIVADVGAAALPGIPGGAGLAIKAARTTVAVAQKVDRAATLVQGVEATATAIESGDVKGAILSGATTVMGARASTPGGKSANATQDQSRALTSPQIKAGETHRYGDFRKSPGDNLEGHELWQNAHIKKQNLDPSVKSDNPSLALTREDHAKVSKVQQQKGLHNPTTLANQSPMENLRQNVKATKEADVVTRDQLAAAAKAAREHVIKSTK